MIIMRILTLVIVSVIFTHIHGQPAVISPKDDGQTSITVSEDVPTSQTIFYVMPANPNWVCTLSSAGPFIFNGCELHTTTNLDYETEPHSYILQITVSDKMAALPKSTATRILTVIIKDVLDAPPSVTVTPSKVSIDEELSPGTILPVRVMGRDPETAIGDEITYFLTGTGSTYFNMNPGTGSMTVVNRLDYEAGLTSFNLVVTVTDKQGHLVTASLTVNINDVNDNSPACAPSTIQTSVEENASAGTLTTLTCEDKDSHTALQYSIAGGDNPSNPSFSMSGSTISVDRALDYETKSAYTLIIHVTDTDHTATVTVNIKVIDKNEEEPRWSVSTLTLDVQENQPLGQPFFTCVATDPDGQPNQHLTYRIASTIPATSSFHINTQTGELSLVANLDYEINPTPYTVKVQATDGGTPPLISKTNLILTLNVLDVNDNSPMFSVNQYTFDLKENMGPGTSVGEVSATDSDGTTANSLVSYMLTSAVTGDVHHFNLDNTGILTTSVTLDREYIPVYIFTVKAVDNGLQRLTGTTTVTVNVDDVNDSPPEFDATTYFGSVNEGALIINIIDMTVTDKDVVSGSPAVSIDQTSSISGIKLDNIFKITNSGNVFTISLKQAVDREADPSFVFNVFVHDPITSSLTSTATVSIKVIDVNEAPTWVTSTSVDVSIPEDVSAGTLVFTVSAIDGDLGPAGQVRYSLISTSNQFYLDSGSGEISTKTLFDYEIGTRSFSLTIRASDNGNPPKVTTPDISLTINILDVNDNVPIFTQSSYTFTVLENKGPLQFVGSVSSTDQDSPPYNEVVYYLDVFPQGKPVPFTIKKQINKDIILTTSVLDRETCDMYTMMIKVTNTGRNLLTSTATVTVIVDDVNDNIPEFHMTSHSGEVREDSPAGTSILKLTVKDKDAGSNGQVSIFVPPSMQGSAFRFEVDNTTGVLSLRVPNVLDREKKSTYTFEVKAVDSGVQPLTSSVTVTVIVTDANDNAPEMDRHFYDTQVDYTGVCGNDIVTVTAHDNDVGNNSQLSYFLVDSIFEYLFRINSATGVVSMKSYLAQNFRYTIEASAKDGGDSALSAAAPSLIRVDAFNLEGTAITFRLGIGKEALEANLQIFITRVEAIIHVNYMGAVLKICCVEERSGKAVIPTSSRRRLLQTSSPIDVHAFVLASNMSANPSNINITKHFLSSTQLTQELATEPRGYPVSKLTSGRMSYFHVESVTPFHLKVTPWAETVEGIVIITFIALIIVVFIAILVIVICYTRKRRKRPTKQVRPSFAYSRKPPRTKMEIPDIDTIKKDPPPVVTSLPFPSFSVKPLPMKTGDDGVANIGSGFRDTSKGPLVHNRKFEGTAVDDETGRVYRYDTRTNKREWVVTPEGRSVTVTHH